MIIDESISRSYANILFNIAISEKIDIWINFINITFQIISNVDFFFFLKSPIISFDKKINIFISILKKNVFLNNKMINFIKILIKNKRFLLFSKIFNQFYNFKNLYENIINIKIISAFKLSKFQLLQIINKIKKIFFYNIKYEIIIKKSLIGGIYIIIKDYIIDISIKENINTLYNYLIY